MTEVDACFQQGFHGYDVRCHSVVFLQIKFSFTSGGFIPSANPERLPDTDRKSTHRAEC